MRLRRSSADAGTRRLAWNVGSPSGGLVRTWEGLAYSQMCMTRSHSPSLAATDVHRGHWEQFSGCV